MGFYLRKGVSVGPFRFNLSKSGIGVSLGFPGLRFGKGPSGNYVHMGRGGLYYRKFNSGGASESPRRSGASPEPSTPVGEYETRPVSQRHADQAKVTRFDSCGIADLVDSSSADLVAELNRRREAVRFAPGILKLSVFAVLASLIFAGVGTTTIAIAVACTAASLFARRLDRQRKTLVLLYDLDEQAQSRYQRLHDAFDGIRRAKRIWHLQAERSTKARKKNAGASTLVNRSPIQLTSGQPPFVATNIEAPILPAGRQTLYFMPDRVLVFEMEGIGAVSYDHLEAEVGTVQFVESSERAVPSDAEVVDYTWQYVNKDGTPDKRYKHNPRLPIVRYEEIYFKSPTGLNEAFQISRVGDLPGFVQAISGLNSGEEQAPRIVAAQG